jgi:thiamine monophosphate kinase
VYAIGRITKAREVVLKENGLARLLEAQGWDHFA